ncbi:MAG: chloride channel protein [Phycisphaerales bacterium]
MRLVLFSIIAGAVVGFVAASFRLTLLWADGLRERALVWAWGTPWWGFAVVVGCCALAAGLAAWSVERFSPVSAGSGIPHVESVLQHDLPVASSRLIPVKFIGGVLAIGSGLALGREGPSVQIGATLSQTIGRLAGFGRQDCRSLLAAGAGAGLATAFNAPIGGSVFVLEELVRRFDTRIAIVTFGASTGAIVVARLMTGSAPDFPMQGLAEPSIGAIAGFLLLGLLLGGAGVVYNLLILGLLNAADDFKALSRTSKAAFIGALVGCIALVRPEAVGGGDLLTIGALHWGQKLWWPLLGLLVLRFVLGPLSYAAQTPGGLFAPLLAVGAQAGVLFGIAWNAPGILPAMDPAAAGVVAMAAFFTAVVRAPLTGIVLVAEMTMATSSTGGGMSLLLPMVAATVGAMLVPTMLGSEPIYESLKQRAVRLSDVKAA